MKLEEIQKVLEGQEERLRAVEIQQARIAEALIEVKSLKWIGELVEERDRLKSRAAELEARLMMGDPDKEAEMLWKNLNRSIEELEISSRSYHCLKNADISMVKELVRKTEREILKIKNFGPKSFRELKEILGAMNLRFGMTNREIEDIRIRVGA